MNNLNFVPFCVSLKRNKILFLIGVNMKKVIGVGLIAITIGSSFGISGVSANTKLNANTVKELQNQLKERHLVNIDKDGMIKLETDLSTLNVNADLEKEYLESMDFMNEQIEAGLISFDSNFNVEEQNKKETEETVDKIYDYDKQHPNPEKPQQQFSALMKAKASSGTPYLDAKELVEENRRELKRTLKSSTAFNYQAGLNFTTSWWVAKVKPNGKWDYKVVSGFKPWNKKFSMLLYSGVEIRNSKWLGNYNYGYTGEILFSLKTLKAGGDAVSYALNFEPDSKAVKAVISRAFKDARTYMP